jgi:poly(hydroxyalkanoate) depolymerase family esterase
MNMNRYRDCVLAMASLSVGLLVAAPARAGTYQKVNQSDWWASVTGLPTYVNMYIFLPATTATKPPIVVYAHHCQGSASSSHSSNGTLESIADKNGFIIIYPEATGENCWDAGSKRSLKHGGGGDTGAIVQMVKYTLSKYSGDAGRVYVAGDSAGGIMTEALLGVYPDVFMAGVSIMGVPCGCWGQSDYNDVTGTGSTAQWCGSCAGGNVSMTGQQWGDLVRSYFPGYTGHRPRLQQWHGATDTTLNFKNVAEDIKEWTNLLTLNETPTGTEQITKQNAATTHQSWKNSCYTVYETFVLAGVGHAVSFDGNAGAAYFGLDKAGGQDPETAVCPGAVPGGGETGGTGGVTGSGGAIGPGGATGAGGRDAAIPGSGGAQADGSSGSGGTVGTGGAGGSSGNGGGDNSGSGGVSAKGGTSGKGGDVATGGSIGSGGSSAPGGSGGDGSGGTHATGGASGQGGNSGSGGSTSPTSPGGCGCTLGNHAESRSAIAAASLFAALGLLLCRPKRRGRRCDPRSGTEHEDRRKHEDR